MAEITIRNKELLSTLDSFVDEMFQNKTYNDPQCFTYAEKTDMEKGEYYCSEEYLNECLSRDALVGAPDRYFATPIAKLVRAYPDQWSNYMQKVKYDFAADLGAHTSALLSYYPPGEDLLDGIQTMMQMPTKFYLHGLKLETVTFVIKIKTELL